MLIDAMFRTLRLRRTGTRQLLSGLRQLRVGQKEFRDFGGFRTVARRTVFDLFVEQNLLRTFRVSDLTGSHFVKLRVCLVC